MGHNLLRAGVRAGEGETLAVVVWNKQYFSFVRVCLFLLHLSGWGHKGTPVRGQGSISELPLRSERMAWKTPLQEGEGQCSRLTLQRALPLALQPRPCSWGAGSKGCALCLSRPSWYQGPQNTLPSPLSSPFSLGSDNRHVGVHTPRLKK